MQASLRVVRELIWEMQLGYPFYFSSFKLTVPTTISKISSLLSYVTSMDKARLLNIKLLEAVDEIFDICSTSFEQERIA